MKTAREAAWTHFESLPSPRLEKSDLTRRSWEVGTVPSAQHGAVPADVQSLLDAMTGPVVCVVDGSVVRSELPAALTAEGVVFTDLHTALQHHGALVEKYLGSVVAADENKWTALNAALWHGGVFLYVPRNVQVDTAFQFVSIQTEASQGAALPRALVVGEEGSAFSFVEMQLNGETAPAFLHSAVTEIVAAAGANIQVMSVNRLRKGPTHFLTSRAKVGKDAVVNWVFGDVGDGYSVALVESVLEGDGSRSLTQGLGVGFGRQHMDLTASMVHGGRYSESDIRLQGVLRERANSIFRSSTHILRGAVGAGSEQHDRMLMIEGTARADAIPMLLIDENDVQRCGHAASVGKIDAQQIYYLMSRGIPEGEAMRMIIWGYLRPTVEAVSVPHVRAWLEGQIERKLTV
ncbi:SufD family Fe-S cluster assembly protein [Alicyclobacillus cycloheptanicus]|nr:SufD family Fe-S cluster assembly protein [Alicyclobacillus cycloheptanicus]